MDNKENKGYYIGLDIGTNSVGWAVTDERYNLCKYKKKSMWGIRLFEEARTAEIRRLKRSARRRLQRKKERIKLLQEIFSEEVAKIDESFFIRLNESRLHLEDKTNNSQEYIHPLFIEKDKEKEFYEKFPTMYHLRKILITTGENEEEKKLYDSIKNDIRYVYLAVHHIIKTRGHFLIDGGLETATSIRESIKKFTTAMTQIYKSISFNLSEGNLQKLEEILKKRGGKNEVEDALRKDLEYEENREYSEEDPKIIKGAMEEVYKFLSGSKGNLIKLLNLDEESLEKEDRSLTLSDEKYEEVRDRIEDNDGNKIAFLEALKALYDASLLAVIQKGEKYLSAAKVKAYEEHHENLKVLKYIFKKYLPHEDYYNFFRNENYNAKANYVAYVGKTLRKDESIDVKKCDEEAFYKNLCGFLERIKPTEVADEDKEILEDVKCRVDNKTLLPRQRTKENGIIPHQVHEQELKQILQNAKSQFTFLEQKDESKLTNIEKIESIFRFRIPYYVGPLSTRHKEQGANVWIEKKVDNVKITPWNFEHVIDDEKCNVNFIERMTNKCTYLIGEDVIPKSSLLYSKYMVLNELNNLKIRGKAVSVKTKQDIYNNLFMQRKKVTRKGLLQYLQKDDKELTKEDLTGFDIDFKSSLSSYLQFKAILGERADSAKYQAIIEDCIVSITIYADGKKRLKKLIKSKYPNELTTEEVEQISKLSFSGWGNFSRIFLEGIAGHEQTTGASYRSLMDALWETNENLMELLSGRYTFTDKVLDFNKEKSQEGEIGIAERVKGLVTSPANKRAIVQTVKIIEEIIKLRGSQPKRIFLEMARGGGEKGKRTNSRKQQLKDLYKAIKNDFRNFGIDKKTLSEEIDKRDERDFRNIKLFLYYTQMGRCMYSGEPINLEQLLRTGENWDRDHILPKSKIKDDSIDNLVLVKNELNREKTNNPISSAIRNKMMNFWKALREKGLISQKKLDSLMKSEYTDEDLAGFINRQLVETRQSSKVVANLCKELYKDSEVIYVKADTVSDFRKDPLERLKSRLLNDYHHAKDAYLNIVVGDVYNAKFTSNPYKWIKGKDRDGIANKDRYSIRKIFEFDVYRGKDNLVWRVSKKEQPADLERIRKILDQNDILYTESTYHEKGQLFDETLNKKSDKKLIQQKKGLDTSKYGGYNSATTSYFAMVEFDGKKKGSREVNMLGVPIYVLNQLSHKKNALKEYFEKTLHLQNAELVRGLECIKKNSLIIVNGYPLRIRGENDNVIFFKNNLQLLVKKEYGETIRKIEKIFEKSEGKPQNVDEKYDNITHEELNNLYDEMLSKLKDAYSSRPANPSKYFEEGEKAEETGEKEETKQLEEVGEQNQVKGRKKFIKSTLLEKIKLLHNVMCIFSTSATTTADLRAIGGGECVGSIAISKNTIGKSKLIFVNQSTTGLIESRRIYKGKK